MLGLFTNKQSDHVKRKCHIRRDKVTDALNWLVKNNADYKETFKDFDITNIPDPIILQNTKTFDDNVEANVEMKEEFTVCFPDATLNEDYGGYNTIKEFKEVVNMVNNATSNNMTVSNKATEYARDYEGNVLVQAFPKQFPYGIGGPDEKRVSNDSTKTPFSLVRYVEHINELSHYTMHEQMFSLICYSIIQRQFLVQNAYVKLKCREELSSKIANMTKE